MRGSSQDTEEASTVLSELTTAENPGIGVEQCVVPGSEGNKHAAEQVRHDESGPQDADAFKCRKAHHDEPLLNFFQQFEDFA